MLKIKLLFVCLIVGMAVSHGQSQNQNFLKGVWELDGPKTVTPDGKKVVLVHYLKIFNADGTFQNLVLHPLASKVSHTGKYTILNNQYYNEVIESQAAESNGKLSGETYKLHYEFADNQNKLYLKGIVKSEEGTDNIQLAETWLRIK